jgi:hypothetical protein
MADLKGHATAMVEAFNNNDLDAYMNLAGSGVYIELATGRSLSGNDLKEAMAGWLADSTLGRHRHHHQYDRAW